MLKKLQKREEGFTLAELLIVVAIIAVLVAIAIPIFTTQLEKSKETTDIANLRAAYAAGTVAALAGEYGPAGSTTKINATGETTAYYNPNTDGSLDGAGGGIKIGQGTSTNGNADISALSGGIMKYNNTTPVKENYIKVTFTDGRLTDVSFAAANS